MSPSLLNRVLASDTCGAISIWDRRVGDLPQTGLTTNANSSLTSIQLNGDQVNRFKHLLNFTIPFNSIKTYL